MAYRLFDLFSGTGAFSKGFENSLSAEYQTVFCNDLLPVAVRTATANHPHAKCVSGDIRKLRREHVAEMLKLRRGQVDVIIGGPPCQGFSSIRPFRSSEEDDPRNSLFEEFASFVNYFRPRALVIENVVGLATHKGGETIEAMQTCFEQLGYDTDWRILNAAHFGIPQRRERLIFIGLPRGAKITFPNPTHSSNGSTIGYRDRTRMLLPDEDTLFTRAPNLEPAITVMEAIGDLPRIESGEESLAYDVAPTNAYQAARRKGLTKLTLHGSTKHTKKMLRIIKHSGPNIYSIPKHLITSGFSSCYSRLDGDCPSVTITVNFVHPASNRCIHPVLNRALTPREGARLQSFDDDFVFCGNRSQIVKQIGNAVPPLLGKVIGEHLASLIA
ncbi:MAG TPA: DNA cytosine methyltransferase [Candidatus Baltobacteraceae bacterium]